MHYCLADYVLDIAQNAVEAGASRLKVVVGEDAGGTSVLVEDNGRGMSDEERKRALDPFYTDGTKHTKRRVGLGLPFLAQAAQATGGLFAIESEKGKGSRVSFRFPSDNVDTPPMGDMAALFLSVLCLPGDHELVVERRKKDGGEYRLVRSELSWAVGGLELVSSLALLREYLVSQEEDQ